MNDETQETVFELGTESAALVYLAVTERITKLERLVSSLLREKQVDAVKPVKKQVDSLLIVKQELYGAYIDIEREQLGADDDDDEDEEVEEEA